LAGLLKVPISRFLKAKIGSGTFKFLTRSLDWVPFGFKPRGKRGFRAFYFSKVGSPRVGLIFWANRAKGGTGKKGRAFPVLTYKVWNPWDGWEMGGWVTHFIRVGG